MAGLPQNFQAFSNVLANYNFVDIASGTGYINFYGGTSSVFAGTVSYMLSNNVFSADPIISTGSKNVNVGVYDTVFDLDFDITLNRPLDLLGKAIINIGTVGDSNQVRTYVEAKIRKWDGVTETEIASSTSSYSDANIYYYHCIKVDISTLTHFKRGETLRLTILVYVSSIGINGVRQVTIAHDPSNRTVGWDTTGAVPSRLSFQCPVRLNL